MNFIRPSLAPPAGNIATEPPSQHPVTDPDHPQILFIPLDAISTKKLQRDRSCHIDPQIDDLKASILATGLSNPIRIDTSRPDRYELIQGWRRLSAYRALLADTGLSCYATIPAIPVENSTSTAKLYRRMVDENMVRKDLSWAEMGRIAIIYYDSNDYGSLDDAIDSLFASTSPQKRSYIRHFADIMNRLGKVLEHPEAIPRALGIALNQALKSESGRTAALCDALRAYPKRDAATELDILRHFATPPEAPDRFEDNPLSSRGIYTPAKPSRAAKRPAPMLRLELMGGAVTATLAPGRIELLLDCDFTQTMRPRLESAIAAFYAALR
jgi:ParB family chromosome partitioning protein